jgi:uncharacterized protein (DUF1499 family)
MHLLPVLKNPASQTTRAYPSLALTLLLSACSGTPPTDIGVRQGHLADCPSSPNCVSSQASDSAHKIAPLASIGGPTNSRNRLLALLANQPRVTVVSEQNNYIRAEFTSRLLRFVDDVEFLLGPQAIEVRSASRLGYSDLGANRARVEQLREQLNHSE